MNKYILLLLSCLPCGPLFCIQDTMISAIKNGDTDQALVLFDSSVRVPHEQKTTYALTAQQAINDLQRDLIEHEYSRSDFKHLSIGLVSLMLSALPIYLILSEVPTLKTVLSPQHDDGDISDLLQNLPAPILRAGLAIGIGGSEIYKGLTHQDRKTKLNKMRAIAALLNRPSK